MNESCTDCGKIVRERCLVCFLKHLMNLYDSLTESEELIEIYIHEHIIEVPPPIKIPPRDLVDCDEYIY